MSFNARQKVDARGYCFLVGEAVSGDRPWFVARLDLNDPLNKPNQVQAVVVGTGYATEAEAEVAAERLRKPALT